MANYSLVINSQFKPFSYSEMLAPVMQSTQAHQAVEDAYSELETKANIWDGMLNKDLDTNAYALYQNFANELRTYADLLAREGLTPAARQSMNRMRARYAKDIVPIETAYKRREADIAAQKEIMLKDPTHLFNRRASEVSLDEYLDNQKLDVLSDNYSRELLTQQVSQAAANLKQTLMKKGALTALGLPYQYERMIQYGASADDVLAAMSKDPKAMPILTKLVEDVMAASGIRNWSSMKGDWANNPTYQAAEAAAMRGLYSAIGTSKIDHFADSFSMQDALNARQHARQVAAQRAAERRAAQQRRKEDAQKTQQALLADVKYGNLFTVSKNNIFNTLKKAGYFSTNKGRTYATKKSKDEYVALQRFARNNNISFRQAMELGTMTNAQASAWINKNVKPKDRNKFLEAFTKTNQAGSLAGDYGVSRKGSLRNAALYAKTLDQLNSGKKILPSYGAGNNRGYGYQPYNIGQLFTKGVPSTTINAQTEWRYDVSGSDSGAALRQLVRDSGTKKGFKVVEFNASTGKYENVGDFNKGALTDDNYEVLSYRMSPAGLLAEIRGKKTKSSEHFYIRLPEDAQSTKAMQKILNNDKVYSNIYGSSPESRQWADVLHSAGISDLYNTVANMYRENEASSQKFESAGMPLFPWQQ